MKKFGDKMKKPHLFTYVGPIAPRGKGSNWIKTVPGKGFFMYFRAYGPTESFFDKSWKLNDVTKTK